MYTIVDMLAAIGITFVLTSIAAPIVFGLAVSKGLDEREERAYWKGVNDERSGRWSQES